MIPEARFQYQPTGGGLPIYDGPPTVTGMPLRDWFAGLALPEVIAGFADIRPVATHRQIAAEAYRYADAMLKAREPSNG